MHNEHEYTDLLIKARDGDQQCADRLAELVRERLQAYVYRIVLRDDVAQDIVQESMLEMFRILDKLKKTEHFWAWLYGIALNKVHRHQRTAFSHKEFSGGRPGYMDSFPDERTKKHEGLEKLIGQELKQVVSAAMRALKPNYRAVLCMRCYDGMTYAEIGKAVGASEFAARMLFYRAKRALAKQLSGYGLGKGSVLTALVLFGKMTASSEAAAANLSVTAASAKVGLGVEILGAASCKTAVVSLATAGVLTVGTIVTTSVLHKPKDNSWETGVISSHVPRNTNTGALECWYYFPEGADGPVMMRTMRSDSEGKKSYCVWRQNGKDNCYFDRHKNALYFQNHRMWYSDLSVWLLPTDGMKLREFISRVEGREPEAEYVSAAGRGLLVITKWGEDKTGKYSRTVLHRNLPEEEYYLYELPRPGKTVDNRDVMHKRGWTYFEIEGRLNGETVSGRGRLPFVYETSQVHTPWLVLNVGHHPRAVDSGAEALIYNGQRKVVESYSGGSFFRGLGRPWMGLHTIDAVRRDAAEQGVWFETKYEPGEEKAEIILTCDKGRLFYTINMKKDIVDKIVIATSDGEEGELRFSYLQDIDEAGDEFDEPQTGRSYSSKNRKNAGVLWLLDLAARD